MDNLIDRLGRRHHGIVTTAQLLAAGWSQDAIDHAVASGRLVRMRRGILRAAGAPVTQDQAWAAAVAAAAGGVVLSGLSATEAYRFQRFPRPDAIHLLSPTASRPRLPGVVGHRTLSLPPFDVTHLRSIPITTPERTFIDVCGAVPIATLGVSGDDLLRRNVLRLPRLVKSFELIPVSGRRTRRPMQAFFSERIRGYDPGGSDSELDVMRIIRRADLPPPVQQHRVRVEGRVYFLDYAYPDALDALEWDSYEFHGRYVSDFHRDKDRTRRLQRAGWTIWPITARTSTNEILSIASAACGHEAAA